MPHQLEIFLQLISTCVLLSCSTWVFVILCFTEANIFTFLVSLLMLYNIFIHLVAIRSFFVIFCVIPYFKSNISYYPITLYSRYSFALKMQFFWFNNAFASIFNLVIGFRSLHNLYTSLQFSPNAFSLMYAKHHNTSFISSWLHRIRFFNFLQFSCPSPMLGGL